MGPSRENEEKSYNSVNYLTIHVWSDYDGGHASMEIHSEKGNDYLSF